MAGQLPKVDERMAKGILTRLGNRVERFKANHPNWTPEGLAKRQQKWAAGITERHQLRRAGTPKGNADRPEPRPRDPQSDIRSGAGRNMSTMPAQRRRRQERRERRRAEEGRE